MWRPLASGSQDSSDEHGWSRCTGSGTSTTPEGQRVLTLDAAGPGSTSRTCWTPWSGPGPGFDPRGQLDRVVAENNKARFALDHTGQKIRASQGHSVPVDLG